MAIVKASGDSEAGKMPSQELLSAMGKFNEELTEAGLMITGEGLRPSTKGARVSFGGEGNRTVTDGPFTETKELIAGFWLLQVDSFDEAVEWMKRCPNPHDEPGEIELREVAEAEDFE
ncbi:MAG TPA: YciI family protein [Solirubrobacterales bacterium]